MKKAISLLLALVMCLSLCACGSNQKSPDSTSQHVTDQTVTTEIKNTETNTEITVTVCASAFSGKDSSDISAFVAEHNFDSFSENEDGSVTITMSRSAKDSAIEYFKDIIDKTFETVRNDYHGEGDLFESVISVSCDDGFTEINYIVDKDTYSVWITAYESAFKQNIAWYKALTGVAPEDVSLIIRYTYEGEDTPFREIDLDFTKRTPKEESQPEETEASTASAQLIQDGDEIIIEDYCKFTVVGWDSVNEITRNGVKMGTGSTNENNTIIRITLDYINTSNSEQKTKNNVEYARDDDLLQSAILTYDGEYTYIGGCGCWSDLIPLTQDDLYIFFNVPKTILDSDGSIDIEFQILDQVFTYTVR